MCKKVLAYNVDMCEYMGVMENKQKMENKMKNQKRKITEEQARMLNRVKPLINNGRNVFDILVDENYWVVINNFDAFKKGLGDLKRIASMLDMNFKYDTPYKAEELTGSEFKF